MFPVPKSTILDFIPNYNSTGLLKDSKLGVIIISQASKSYVLFYIHHCNHTTLAIIRSIFSFTQIPRNLYIGVLLRIVTMHSESNREQINEAKTTKIG